MSRIAREEVFASDEIAVVHVMSRTVRRCFLMGYDHISKKNYDHRKIWIEQQLANQAQYFCIDLCSFVLMDNHTHQVLRSRPDVVTELDDREVARRWLMLCPIRRDENRQPMEPTEFELNRIINDTERVLELRSRLSDISWWMRLLCQHIAQRANREDNEPGKFWQARYKAVRLLDEMAILACTAYVDLNPIRAGVADTIEGCLFTSANRRANELKACHEVNSSATLAVPMNASDSEESTIAEAKILHSSHLAPVELCEHSVKPGPQIHLQGTRCSDKGFLPITTADYLDLLALSALQQQTGRSTAASDRMDLVLARLQITRDVWRDLVKDFGRLFNTVAGKPNVIDSHRSLKKSQRFRPRMRVRELLAIS